MLNCTIVLTVGTVEIVDGAILWSLSDAAGAVDAWNEYLSFVLTPETHVTETHAVQPQLRVADLTCTVAVRREGEGINCQCNFI